MNIEILEFETYHTGTRILNRLLTYWVTTKEILKRWKSYSVRQDIHSVEELKGEETAKVFSTDEIDADFRLLVSTNLPSIYGGTKMEPWYMNRSTRALPESVIPDSRLGHQSYSDNKMELMG